MKFIIFFIVLILLSSFAYSCDCPPLDKLSVDILKKHGLIFKGKVDSVIVKDEKSLAWFTIDELYKGSSEKTTGIYFDNSTSCQMQVESGDQWLIYADYVKFAKPEANFCGRSRKYFTDKENDFYIANNGVSYEDEITYLRNNFGVQNFKEDESSEAQYQRELIHPTQLQMLYWLAASLVGFLGIYYLIKKLGK